MINTQYEWRLIIQCKSLINDFLKCTPANARMRKSSPKYKNILIYISQILKS